MSYPSFYQLTGNVPNDNHQTPDNSTAFDQSFGRSPASSPQRSAISIASNFEVKKGDPASIYYSQTKYGNIGFLLIPIFIILLIFLKINFFDNLSGGKNNHKKLKKYYKKLKLI